MKLTSFASHLNVVVIGSSGGIGQAFVGLLEQNSSVDKLWACSRKPEQWASQKTTSLAVDILDEASIQQVAATASADGPIDLVVVTTGILHQGQSVKPEKSWRDINADSMQQVYAINSIAPALLAKHFLPKLRKDHKSVFAVLSARVGSIGDNRLGGWVAYRSSKAALNMIVRTLSIELARRSPKALCVALHPGTVDTQLSSPFQANVPEGKLFSPEFSATQLLSVVDQLTAEDSGGLFAWDGERIPY